MPGGRLPSRGRSLTRCVRRNAQQVPEALLGEALALVRSFGDEEHTSQMLSDLADRMPEPLLVEALDVAGRSATKFEARPSLL